MDLSGTQAAPGRVATPHWLEQVEQWLAKQWVPALINLAVLVLLCFILAQGTWRLFTAPTSSDAPPAIGAADASGEFNLQALLSANLFGQAAPAAKASESLETIPLSSLNLVLTGVMVTPAGSFALISSDGGPEAPFAVGQDVVAGVSLYAVYADRVLIRRGGATESLMLKDTGTNLPEGSIRTAPSPSANPATGVQRRSENNFAVNRQQLTQQMQKPDFLTQALMVPNAGGGFLVREIQPGSMYEKLGLRVGDVIQSVNGQPVNTMEDVMRLYQQFESVASVSMEIRRAGRTETLSYNFQ